MTRAPAARLPRPTYRCDECGAFAAKWVGRCSECQCWGSVREVTAVSNVTSLIPGQVTSPAVPIGDVDLKSARARPTGVTELDRVLGGGLVPGAAVLLAGEPGVGKSTLLLEVAVRAARSGQRVLVVSGEESAGQVRLRAERTGTVHHELWIAAETELGALAAHVEAVQPGLLIVDSVQTIASSDVDGAAGGASQVREVSGALIRMAKSRGMTCILVGHVTKDGGIAGPRLMEHLVDVVLQFEGERHSTLRLVRAAKNRFGPADEVGCFEMREDGIVCISDPSGLFVTRREVPVTGTCRTVAMEGRRPLVAEVQALVSPTQAVPRRGVTGLDSSRTSMILAVVEHVSGEPFSKLDVHTASVGGMRMLEPAADLAIAMAIASSSSGRTVPPGMVVLGEVGLAGDIRPVPAVPRRVAEAARMGFTRAIVPAGCIVEAPEMQVFHAATLLDALQEGLGLG